MTTHCKPTTSRFVSCNVPRVLPKVGLTISVAEPEEDLPSGESLVVSFSIGALGPFQLACHVGACRDGSEPPAPSPAPPAPAPKPPAASALNPCSALSLAAHPERSESCDIASYGAIFFGPLAATASVLLLVLLLGGGCRGLGGICLRRCLPPDHLGAAPRVITARALAPAAAPAPAPAPDSRAVAPLVPTLPAMRVDGSDDDVTAAACVSSAVSHDAPVRLGIAFSEVACRAGLCRGERVILRGVSGVCRAGERLAVMGPSGCGKTTLLDILSGRKNTGTVSGEVRIDGRVLHSRARRQCTSMVFQDDVLPATSTAAEFLEFHTALRPTHAPAPGGLLLPPLAAALQLQLQTRGAIVERRRARMRRYIEQMGLSKCIHTTIGDELTRGLSGGEKKRVAIASGLVSSPRVLFLDEPTSGLDSSSAQSVVAALDVVVNDGCAVVFVIHQPPAQLFETFDRLILLSASGRALYSGPRRDVLRYFAGEFIYLPLHFK